MLRLSAVCLMISEVCLALAHAQAMPEKLLELEAKGHREGWTFTVGENSATSRPLSDLCGLVVPSRWLENAPVTAFEAPSGPKESLPAVFDLRPYCPPARSQEACGSCWAFGTVGALECAIILKDGEIADLSEQWLISCNEETEPPHLLGGTWGCNGGWFAHDYHQWKPDACGGFGAVLESACPYVAEDTPCACPYNHVYYLDDWGYVAGEESVPSVEAIKLAIMSYGPLSASVFVNDAFQWYTDGVFNASDNQEVNHAIVLVGWDDAKGANGAWILRNSWGADWGIEGYMYIEYGCSNVGFAAAYVDYPGTGDSGLGPEIVSAPGPRFIVEGDTLALDVQAAGLGALRYEWFRDGAAIGQTSRELILPAVQVADSGSYTCRVSDLRGSTVTLPVFVEVAASADLPLSNAALLLGLTAALVAAAWLVLDRWPAPTRNTRHTL
jgi:hypothetical protein